MKSIHVRVPYDAFEEAKKAFPFHGQLTSLMRAFVVMCAQTPDDAMNTVAPYLREREERHDS